MNRIKVLDIVARYYKPQQQVLLMNTNSLNPVSSRYYSTSNSNNNNNNNNNKSKPISAENQRILDEELSDLEEENNEQMEYRNPITGEIGGVRGPEPTRYGDWERKGRLSDF